MDKLTSFQPVIQQQYLHPNKLGLFSRSNLPCAGKLKKKKKTKKVLIFNDIVDIGGYIGYECFQKSLLYSNLEKRTQTRAFSQGQI